MIRAAVASRQIYELLYRFCPAYRLSGEWKKRSADADVRACPMDPGSLLKQLSQRFPKSALLRAGVAREGPEGSLQLAAALESKGAPLVFLRPGPKQMPVEVLTRHGCLSGKHLPLIASLSDHRTVEALNGEEGYLLVACSIEDVVVLRSLGIAATLTTGLDNLNAGQLFRLCEQLGWTIAGRHNAIGLPGTTQAPESVREEAQADSASCNMPLNQAADSQQQTKTKKKPVRNWLASLRAEPSDQSAKPSIILLGWSPATLLTEPPAQLEQIQAHLRTLQEDLDIDDMDVGVWCPSRHYIDRLRVQLRFNLWKPCAAEMFEEIDDFSKDAIAVLPPETPPTPPPTNFTEAAQRLRAALRADWRLPASHECLRQAHEAFDQRLEAEVIQPLFRPAAPPHKRNLQVALMEASRLLHRLGPPRMTFHRSCIVAAALEI